MERLKGLNRYQQALLLLTVLMIAVFIPIYSIASSRVGFEYMDKILLPETKDGTTVYSGRIEGKPISFTVIQNQVVLFQWGDQKSGPYTVTEDDSAIPDAGALADLPLKGIEVRKGEQLLFRGGALQNGANWYLYGEDGSYETISGDLLIRYDEDHLFIEETDPSVETVLSLLNNPVLKAKGDWIGFCYGLLIAVANVVYILFADELFRHKMSFQIANVQDVEPSEWEIVGRYISWTLFTAITLVLFIVGLL